MKKTMLTTIVSMVALGSLFAADAKDAAPDPAAPAPAAPAAAPEKPKKKIPKKPMYTRLKEAVEVAQGWNHPILVFFLADGEDDSAALRGKIIGRRELTKFWKDNVVLLVVKIKAEENKQRGRQKKKPAFRPDMNSLKPEERQLSTKCTALGSGGWSLKMEYPCVYMLDPNGVPKARIPNYNIEDGAGPFIDAIKGEMTNQKYECITNKDVDKLILEKKPDGRRKKED